MTQLDANDRDEEYAWRGCIRIDPIVDGPDELGWALFGFSKFPENQKREPIARRRGIPTNPSDEVRRDMEMIAVHEKRYGSGEIGNYTWIAFEDVEAVDWKSVGLDPSQSDWHEVFEMIRLLRRADRFSQAGFRIVAWTNW